MKKELILIDASWVIHRMWHVHSNLSVTLKNGVELKSGHIYGFARLLKTLTTGYPEADIIICLDGKATHGKELNPDYKGNREHGVVKTAFDDLGVLIECVVAFNNVKVAFNKDLEADEIISYLCDTESLNYASTIVYSADGDMVQLLDSRTFIAKEFDKGLLKLVDENTYYTDEKYVSKFCACKIDCLPLYRAMVGDSSDNLPGFPRLRKKLAKEISEKYKTVENIVEAVDIDTTFPDGFKDFLTTLKTNFEIMKLPNASDLVYRGVVPRFYENRDSSIASSLFSLYRIRSASPVPTFEVTDELEETLLKVRDDVNFVWKHPNSSR